MSSSSQSLQTQANIKLMESGHRERLYNNLTDLLHSSGWFDQARVAATRAIREQQANPPEKPALNSDGDPISDFAQVCDKVQEEMLPKVPTEVQREIYRQIALALHQVMK